MVALRESDFRSALEVLRVAEAVDGADAFPEPVLHALRRLVPCDRLSYREWTPDGCGEQVWVSADEHGGAPGAWQAYPRFRHQDPLPGRPSAGARLPIGAAVRFSDLLTRRQLTSLELYQYVCRPLGIEYVMKLFLPAPAGTSRGFVFDRVDRDFDERDRARVELLVGHFVQLRWNADVRQRLPALATRAADGGSAAASLLTEREREVLWWIARGKQNREVAHLLYISERTVAKHLERLYHKLGVHNRTAAAAAVFPRGTRLHH